MCRWCSPKSRIHLQGYEYGRAPVADVYAQIIKDLTDAEAALPATLWGADVGRATSGAAKGVAGQSAT